MQVALVFISLICIFVALLILLATYKIRMKKIETPPEPPPKEEGKLYGHPWPPVTRLRKDLPSAPPGYAWETKVVVGSRGDDIMHLSLFNLTTEELEGGTKVNLTQYRDHDTTWEVFYKRYSTLGEMEFNTKIILPCVTWAKSKVNEMKTGEVSDYNLDV